MNFFNLFGCLTNLLQLAHLKMQGYLQLQTCLPYIHYEYITSRIIQEHLFSQAHIIDQYSP